MLFFSYVSGVIGILYTISFSPFLTFKEAVVYIISIVICSIIWFLYNSKKRNIIWILFALLVLFNISFFMEQWKTIWIIAFNNLKYLKNIDITETIVIFSGVVALIIYWLTFKKGKGWLIYLVSIAVIIVGPIIGNPPDIIQICLFVFFHIGTSITGNMISSKKNDKVITGIMNNAGVSALFTAVFFIISLIIANKITDKHMESLYDIPVTMEEKIKDITTIWNSDTSSKGKVSRGNNSIKGIEKLEVTVSEKPDEIIYLKDFIGLDYLDNKWEKDDQANYWENEILRIYPSEEEKLNPLIYFDRQYYLAMNYEFEENPDLYEDSSKFLRVKKLTSEEDAHYIPYISQYHSTSGKEDLFVTYSEQKFLNGLQNTGSESLKWFLDMERGYDSYAKDRYLNVSKERFPRLLKLSQENYFYGVDNITEFIKSAMWSRATYSLSPGRIPLNEEIPEYFLFERGKGYCVHFATTATLLYRMYGIPARYVTGYIAKPSQFKEESGGTYKATLTDAEAHAWVEIYKKDYGWQKVEVTPSISDVNTEIYEEEDNNIQEEINPITESNNEENEIEKLPDEISDNGEEATNDNWKLLLGGVKVLLIIIAALTSIVGLYYFVIQRRKKILRKYRRSYSDKLVTKIVEVLHFGGYIKEYTGMEPEFPQVISDIVPKLSNEEAEKIVKYAIQEAFGNSHVSPIKTKETLNAYKKSCNFVYENLPIWKKGYFKYIKAYW